MGAVKRQAMQSGKITSKQEASYNRFFVTAFTDKDIDEIVEQGGAQSKDNFVRSSKTNIKNIDYWKAMFNKSIPDKTFRGRDGKVRRSKFQPSHPDLASAVYDKYFKGLQDDRVTLREYSFVGKTKTFFVVRRVVTKGKSLTFGGKLYKGGRFLPKAFKLRRKL